MTSLRNSFVLMFVHLIFFASSVQAGIVLSNIGDTGFGGPVQFELGGTTPGNSDNNHDQINSSGFIVAFPTATLEILPFPVTGSFIPSDGDQFEILTWQTGIFQDAAMTMPGGFQNVTFDPFFVANGITFDTVYTNPGGAGNLTLVASAVPEPSVVLFGCVISLGLLGQAIWKKLSFLMVQGND